MLFPRMRQVWNKVHMIFKPMKCCVRYEICKKMACMIFMPPGKRCPLFGRAQRLKGIWNIWTSIALQCVRWAWESSLDWGRFQLAQHKLQGSALPLEKIPMRPPCTARLKTWSKCNCAKSNCAMRYFWGPSQHFKDLEQRHCRPWPKKLRGCYCPGLTGDCKAH